MKMMELFSYADIQKASSQTTLSLLAIWSLVSVNPKNNGNITGTHRK
jgi:hypothetical protein